MITFKEIPTGTLTPFMFVEFGERANYDSLSTKIRGLLIGDTADTNNHTLKEIRSLKEAEATYGDNSDLYRMVEYFFKNSSGHSIHCIGKSSDKTIVDALKKVGDQVFHVIGAPVKSDDNRTTELNAAIAELDERFSATSGLGGTLITYTSKSKEQMAPGDLVDLLTEESMPYNSKSLCLFEGGRKVLRGSNIQEGDMETIGAIIGRVVESASVDPAIPFQFLELKGILPRDPENQLNRLHRQHLLEAGVSTLQDSNRVVIETLCTTYKETETGAPDKRWSLLNTVLLATYIRADLINYFLAKYGRAKLGEDSKNYAPGQKIMTPVLGKSEIIGKLREYEYKGFVENVDKLIETIQVEKEGNTLKFSAEVDLMNQLKQVWGLILI